MNAGATAERVYHALKRRLLSGEFVPGGRLEPARLSESLASSVTPVRDALHRLVGERLVESRASEGFHLPLVTEGTLRDQYRWHEDLLRLAIRAWPTAASRHSLPVQVPQPSEDAPALFALIASRSDNGEYGLQIVACTDRLATARFAENSVFDDIESELRSLSEAFLEETSVRLSKLVRIYHRRRLRAVPDIVRRMYLSPMA